MRGDELSRYGLGDVIARVHSMLDGRTPLADVVARARSNDARTNLQRLIYFLVLVKHARVIA